MTIEKEGTLVSILPWNDPEQRMPEIDSELLLWDGVMFHTYFYYGKTLPECELWAYLPDLMDHSKPRGNDDQC